MLGTPRLRIANIADGTSNTLLFAEAAEPVLWTKPDDVTYDGKEKLLPKLGGLFKDGFHAAHCDGSVRFYRKKDVTEDFLRKFIGRDDGEAIEFPQDRRDRRGGGLAPASAPKERAPEQKPEKQGGVPPR